MRVLWISSYSGLLNTTKSGYNGAGWVSSLQREVVSKNGIELGLAFAASESNKIVENGTTYYAVHKEQLGPVSKLLYYYGGYKKTANDLNIDGYLKAIDDFKPDIIQFFGTESPELQLIRHLKTPHVVHLQGVLSACQKAFLPPALGLKEIRRNGNFIRENILRNGFAFNYESMITRGKYEAEWMRDVKNFIGRTEWDRQMSATLSPNSRYFHVDEVLRQDFYEAAKWKLKTNEHLVLCSTISETIYKGLDLILKTADLLKGHGVDFEWQVAGMQAGSDVQKLFEKVYGINAKEVNINFLGIRTACQLKEMLSGCDFYIHPSYIDNSPNSVCEAQLLGVPIIACDVGGLSSLIDDGKNGWLVPSNAPYEIVYLLEHRRDLPLSQISNSAIEIATQRHDRSKIVEQLMLTYKELL